MEKEDKDNSYWFTTYTMLLKHVDEYYDNCYDSKGNNPKPILQMDSRQLNALIEIISEATCIIEGANKTVSITVEDIEEHKYKK
tara:strand:+ start:269 stop:520 length:252 start_codon:yes stop_codon:yes gene_type:complete